MHPHLSKLIECGIIVVHIKEEGWFLAPLKRIKRLYLLAITIDELCDIDVERYLDWDKYKVDKLDTSEQEEQEV